MAFTIHKNPEYLTSQVIGSGAVHCFSTRRGGVSQGCLSSLNLGIHRGDLPENVLENYRRLGAAAGFEPADLVFARQTHTDIVTQVGKANRGDGLFLPVASERDGLITNEPNVALTIFSADCTPILLYDPVRHAIGAVHSGWRGTAAGIVTNAVEAMSRAYGSDPKTICAAIGPCIGACCFETDSDVPQAMTDALGEEAQGAMIDHGNGKFHIDLKQLNAVWLRRAGVVHVDISTDCTACQPERFWSHRRVGSARGSLAAIIMLKEAHT